MHTKSPAVFLSVSIVGMTPSMRTPVMASTPIVECVPQSHVVMPDTTPTHGEGQPPLALHCHHSRQCVGSGCNEGTYAYIYVNSSEHSVDLPFPVLHSRASKQETKIWTMAFIVTLLLFYCRMSLPV